MEIKIRKAKPDEYNKVLALYPKASKEELEKVKKHVKSDFEKIKSKNRIIYFAEIDNQVIATVQLVFELEDKDLADGKTIANLHHLRVSRPYRKQGIGKILEKHLINEAKKRVFEKITLSVEHNDSFDFLTQLYKKWGYKIFKEKSNETCFYKNILSE